ncbi:zinc finger and SCAN domain-containing protein 29-like [Macrochelys suwanniensis]
MMESQNRRRAPAWTERGVRDLIAVWGDESVLEELRAKRRNANTYAKVSKGMQDRGYNRDAQQCRVKIKELRQAYQRTRDANSRSGSEPQTCRFYDELHAILGGVASTDPPMWYDSVHGASENSEEHFREEEDDDNDAEDSAQTQQGSGEAIFPDSQELFVTLEPVPYEPTQGMLPDLEGGEGTSTANVSMLPLSSPSQRLAKIRSKKKKKRIETICSQSSCSPPTLKRPSRMHGGRHCWSPERHNLIARTGGVLKTMSGGLKRVGGVSMLREGRMQF